LFQVTTPQIIPDHLSFWFRLWQKISEWIERSTAFE
jgi:hypothetical protein